MSQGTYIGIDYGCGLANVDTGNGIRYGVISPHTIGERWYEDSDADYGDPSCGECGGSVEDFDADLHGAFKHGTYSAGAGCRDYACANCERVYSSEDCFPDESTSEGYTDDDYTLEGASLGVYVTKSPYFTLCAYCSPCCPGAGDLDSPRDGGVKTYCLGPEWFDDDVAPYVVYSVATGEIVQAGPVDDDDCEATS